MMSTNKFMPELIAPCGMNCGICRAYLAYIHGVPTKKGKVTHCAGCLPRAKNCYIKRGCPKLSKHLIESCSQCDAMPCKNLTHLDKRYRESYNMSMVDNLSELKINGMETFLKNQQEKYRCPNCGDIVSVHNQNCYSCDYRKKTKPIKFSE